VSEQDVPNLEVAVDRALNMLHSLGNQIFAVSPFSAHFDRWLTDLRVVLSEFESNPNVAVDEQFVEERSKILSNVEAELEERRRKEASGDKAFRDLSNDRLRLERIEEEYAAEEKEFRRRRDSESSRLSRNVDELREELNRAAQMKTGIFRGVSKKAKKQKEEEAARRLDSAQKKLASALKNFTVEQEKLRDEYERMKQFVMEEMRNEQKEVDSQEIDSSLEARQTACRALADSVKTLSKRQRFPPP
jgi:hypothetical protein